MERFTVLHFWEEKITWRHLWGFYNQEVENRVSKLKLTRAHAVIDGI